MQGNQNVSKIIRSKPQSRRTEAAEQRGKQWTRTDKRQSPMLQNSQR